MKKSRLYTFTASILALSVIFLLYIFYNNNKFSIEKIQESVLEHDKTRNIGTVFNSYQYFSETKWGETIDQQGRSVVSFTGTVNYDFDSYINKALYDSKNIKLKDASGYVNLLYYYSIFPTSLRLQPEKNEKEAERVAKIAPTRRGLAAKISIDFAKSLKDSEIIITNKKIIVYNKESGEEVSSECDNDQASTAAISMIYKDTIDLKTLSTCIFKYDLTPITEMEEYPKDIKRN